MLISKKDDAKSHKRGLVDHNDSESLAQNVAPDYARLKNKNSKLWPCLKTMAGISTVVLLLLGVKMLSTQSDST